jgi:hypothetical protein
VVCNLLLVAGTWASVALQLLFAGRFVFYFILPLGYLIVTLASIWWDWSQDLSVQACLQGVSRSIKAVVDALDIPFKLALLGTIFEVNGRWLRNAARAAAA